MLVYKFGGTSVGSVENMRRVMDIINDGQPKVVVLSAMSGTTNALLQINNKAKSMGTEEALKEVDALADKYHVVISDLLSNEQIRQDVLTYVDGVFDEIRAKIKAKDPNLEKEIVIKGEFLSTYMFHKLLTQEGIENQWISALDFMVKNVMGEPDKARIRDLLTNLYANINAELIITQGFACRDHQGQVDNLERGGSDYSASLIGEALKAEEIQIWTDIDGFHNNDPRFVDQTHPIDQLSFDEAAELAYFGAKILHPQSVLPAKEANIPVRLKNTMQADAPGTIVKQDAKGSGIKAIAAKDDVTVVKIKSARMFLAHGFLEKVFSIFAKYGTSVDMITTSEIAVSLTIDNPKHIGEIEAELSEFAHVELEDGQSIISIVGQDLVNDEKTPEIFSLLREMPVRMICYGGSRNNISLVLDTSNKKAALQKLNAALF